MRPLAVFVCALLVAGGLLAPPARSAEPAWWETTALDADRDRLDDALACIARGGAPCGLGPDLHGAPEIEPDGTLKVLVSYAAVPGPAERAALEHLGFVVVKGYAHFPLLVVRAPLARIAELRDALGVEFVEANDVVVPLLKESVPLVGAPQAWKSYGVTGRGVTIAVLDDGVFEQHPDFDGKIAGHFDASNPVGRQDPVGLLTPASEAGHGTHVAGTIAGAGDQSGGEYRGVAPDARFANVKVFLRANQTSSDYVLDGLDWTLENRENLNIRVASMSLGGRPSDGTDAISRAASLAVDEGLVIVAAAGNAGEARTIASPGAAEKVITVGAVDKRKQLAPYSSQGPTLDGRAKPDIAAPGSGIVSTIPPVSTTGFAGLFSGRKELFYGELSGTSMATPHVAGAVALMLEANPDLAPIDVKRILLVTAQDLGPEGRDNETGYGFLNAVAAVQVAEDPSLLEQARFRSILETIPDPPPESLLTRLQFDAERALQDPRLVTGAAVGLAALALVLVGVALLRRKGR